MLGLTIYGLACANIWSLIKLTEFMYTKIVCGLVICTLKLKTYSTMTYGYFLRNLSLKMRILLDNMILRSDVIKKCIKEMFDI